MKSLHLHCGIILFGCVLTTLALMAPSAGAQARKANASRPVGSSALRGKVSIKKIDGIGSAAKIKTPEYSVSISENLTAARDWARVLVQFETVAEWTDALEFKYFVQVQNQRTRLERRFLGNFTYVDIPKGKQHLSSVFLRPNTLERYGDIIGVAVEVYVNGELVATAANPNAPRGWWRTATIKEVSGVLLERSQTPFAFVAYDAYVTEKPR